MNAVSLKTSKAGSFAWLLKREFWEYRGAFFWSQVITGGIAVFFAALGVVIGVISARNHGLSGSSAGIDDMREYARTLGAVGDGLLLGGIAIASVVLAFVVFTYSIGCLYNDRQDRSVLFWKSLPVSDTRTVLAKVAWALLLAPLIALAIGLLVGITLWLIAMLGVAAAGAPNPWAMATHSHPFRLLGLMLATVPMSLLWSLPTIGWLMFCSAWARSKPFLWAVLLPLLACVMISILAAMPGVRLPLGWVWYIVAYRGLLSVWPGTWSPRGLQGSSINSDDFHTPGDVINWVLQHNNPSLVYGNPDIWIGAAAGIAFIAAAIYLRRRSGEI